MAAGRFQKSVLWFFAALMLAGAVAANEKIDPALQASSAEAVADELQEIIVEYEDGAVPDAAGLEGLGCVTGHALHALHGIAAECPAETLEVIAADEAVAYVWEDTVYPLLLDSTVSLIGAPDVWAQYGDGTGINVSIIDSGINASHPALEGKVILEKDFTGEDPSTTDDRCNHGTAVACVVGCEFSAHTGVAPGARLFNARVSAVLNPNPLQCGASTSAILAAIDWSVEHRAHVIQISIGGPTSGCYQNALAVAINRTAQNTTIVIGAGNGGSGAGTIWVPGCAENVITVGATNHDGDGVEGYSSRGPTDYGAEKPDLVAPGSQISTASNDGQSFQLFTGTSFASPYVAGVAALMLQQRRLRPWEIKTILNTTSTDLFDARNTQGAGLVNAFAATNATAALPSTVVLNVSQLFRDDTVSSPPFRVNATLTNEGNTQANGTGLRIVLPAEVELLSPETADTSMIPGLEQKKTGWLVQTNVTGNYTIAVVANASNANATNASAVIELFAPFAVLTTTPAVPANNKVAQPFAVNATVANTGFAAQNLNVTLAVPQFLSVSGGGLQQFASLAAGASVVVNWTVNASKSGNYSANVTVAADTFAANRTFFVIPVEVTAFGVVLELNNATGRDAYVRSSSPTLNWGASPLLRVDASPNYRPLLYWDLSGIPPYATVLNATMTLFVNSVMSTMSNTVRAFRVTQDWTEGTGNGQDTDNGATWLTYNGTASWAANGGDYNSTVWASQAVTTANKYQAWNVTGLVAYWFSTGTNKGLLLNATGSSTKDFASSDSTNASRRPRLQVNYTL
jgi:subtilisin family serine protease